LGHITASIFSKLLNEQYLWIGIEIFILAIIIILAFTYATLYLKKKKFVYQKYLHKNIEDWLGSGIIEDADRNVVALPTLKFLLILKNPMLRQLTINELLHLKKSFSGEAAKNITLLYVQLGLKDFSMKKLKSNKWHVKARAIQELYLMQQREALPRIYKNVNSFNEFIRMEAQIGIIHLIGFDGLRFLNVINNKLTEWQQIKLLDQLAKFPINEDVLAADIPRWLKSPNETVIIFALKLAHRYHRYTEYHNVVECLNHPNELVRRQAVNTLHSLADKTTSHTLIEHFNNETYFNKLNMLNCLEDIATEDDSEFITGLLQDPDDTLKLKVARVLALCHKQGLRTLEKAGQLQPEPYQKIYLHIKNELAR
jgi:hypothetical protein